MIKWAGGSGPGSEICWGGVGEQTDMQPDSSSRVMVKVWKTEERWVGNEWRRR